MGVLAIIFQYLPYVLQAVMAAEAAIGSGKGTTKKAIVMAAITAVAKVGETVPQATVTAISTLVDEVVGLLNASGIFTHSATPAPTA